MRAQPVYARAVGMACPVGLTARSATAAIRAGLNRRQTLPYIDNAGEPITGSFLKSLKREADDERPLSRTERWFTLLVHALSDLRAQVGDAVLEKSPFLCVVPRAARPQTRGPMEGLCAKLSVALGLKHKANAVRFVGEQSCDAYKAIADAAQMLKDGDEEGVVVCAADSLINARCLLELERDYRLLSETNSDGVTPGEAAACVLLSANATSTLGIVHSTGFASEPGLLDNDVPLLGEGVARAARVALHATGIGLHCLDFRVSDAGGESYHFREQALLMAKLLRERKEEFPLRLVAEAIGYCGGATGLCGLVEGLLACHYGLGRSFIACAGSDGPARAAAVVAVDGETQRPFDVSGLGG